MRDFVWHVCCSLPPCSSVLFLCPTVIQPLWSVYRACHTGRVWSPPVLDEDQEQQKQTVPQLWALPLFSSWAKFSVEVRCLFLLAMTYHSWGTCSAPTAPRPLSPLLLCVVSTSRIWKCRPGLEAASRGPLRHAGDQKMRKTERERVRVLLTRLMICCCSHGCQTFIQIITQSLKKKKLPAFAKICTFPFLQVIFIYFLNK